MPVTATHKSLSQRADYTHQHNASAGRHGWLRLTPAYSLKIVDEILADSDGRADARVLDPFCGTGTTALCASYRGRTAVTTEINPFLVWLSRAKTDYYAPRMIAGLRADGRTVADGLRWGDGPHVPLPRMRNIERWWSPEALDFLRALKGAVDARFTAEAQPRTLFLLAFCRTLIKLSNAAFNHQSMSFKPPASGQDGFGFQPDWPLLFKRELEFVLDGALVNPTGEVQVVQADARRLPPAEAGAIDCVITSPPYVNRMSYIRELRPYMYWLGHLENGRDAGEMDWAAIGGTWGGGHQPAGGMVAGSGRLPAAAAAEDGRADRRRRAQERGVARGVRAQVLRRHVATLPVAVRPAQPWRARPLHRGQLEFLRNLGSGGADLRGNAGSARLRRHPVPAHPQAEFQERVDRVRGERAPALRRTGNLCYPAGTPAVTAQCLP